MVRDGGYGNLAGWLIPRALHCLVECGVFGWRIRSAGANTPPVLTSKTGAPQTEANYPEKETPYQATYIPYLKG